MNIQYIEHESIMNGDGNRCVLWVSGCNHHCPLCQNPETHDPKSGHEFTTDDLKEIFEVMENPYIRGITLSGGDPLFPENRFEIEQILKIIKSNFPKKTIWLYTGYLWEEIKDLPLLQYVDVLKDGPFIYSKLDVKYHWAGSTNQRVIDVKNTLDKGEIVLWQ